jgi:hypothetical protein
LWVSTMARIRGAYVVLWARMMVDLEHPILGLQGF